MDLDKVDRGILSALDGNARQSNQQIAKQVGVSKEVVQYRIKRLEKEKIIEGYYALVDFAALGYLLVRVYLKLQNDTEELREVMIKELVMLPDTLTVYTTDFAWDIAIGFMTKSFVNFDGSWRSFEVKFRQFIDQVNVSVIFEFIHYPRKYLAVKKNNEVKSFTTAISPVKKLDVEDMKLLRIISKDAKIPIVNLAKKIGLTPSAAIYRLRALEREKILLAYKASIDFNKLGYEYYKVDVKLEDLSVRQKMSTYLRQHPNVTFEDRTVGGSDLEFDIEVPSYEDFVRLIDQLRAAFPNTIRSYTFYRARKIHKYLYVPEN